MIQELRVTDADGRPVELAVGLPMAITVDGDSFQGRVASSDQGGAVGVEFDEQTYAAYRKARDSKRPAAWIRTQDFGR